MSDLESQRTRLDKLCDAFERAYRNGQRPDLLEFAAGSPREEQATALSELLKVELELRHGAGERPSARDYVVRFPDHAAVVERVFESLAARDAETLLHNSQQSHSGPHVRCPRCHEPIRLVSDAELEAMICPVCGSDFSLVGSVAETKAAPTMSQIGQFRLVERVGMGAFGSVWKAEDTKLQRTVAIKIPRNGQFDKKQEKAFLREAQNAAQLSHANIVPVYEVGREGDALYIVSEFVRGVSLADWLTGQQLSVREAAQLCTKIASALEHAHENGVVHRDLKPSNIMLDPDGEPHLMDFGLAKRETGEITMSLDGQILGTPAYMSPEQARGDAHSADRRSDVYSLGVILFELLTGELPFRGNQRMLLYQVIHDDPPSPRKLNANVPMDLVTITLKCLEKDPIRRYASAQEVKGELVRFMTGKSIQALPVGPLGTLVRWYHRRPEGARLVSGALLAVLGAVLTMYSLAAVPVLFLVVPNNDMPKTRIFSEVAAITASIYVPILLSGILTLYGRRHGLWLGLLVTTSGFLLSLGAMTGILDFSVTQRDSVWERTQFVMPFTFFAAMGIAVCLLGLFSRRVNSSEEYA